MHQQNEDAVLCREFITEKTTETTGAERNWVKFADAFPFFFSLFFSAGFVLRSLNSHMGGVCKIRISFRGQVCLG